MIRNLVYLLPLTLLLIAGCVGHGDKEAQLEFERLRQRTTPFHTDPFRPDFGTEPCLEQVLEHADRSDLRA